MSKTEETKSGISGSSFMIIMLIAIVLLVTIIPMMNTIISSATSSMNNMFNVNVNPQQNLTNQGYSFSLFFKTNDPTVFQNHDPNPMMNMIGGMDLMTLSVLVIPFLLIILVVPVFLSGKGNKDEGEYIAGKTGTLPKGYGISSNSQMIDTLFDSASKSTKTSVISKHTSGYSNSATKESHHTRTCEN